MLYRSFYFAVSNLVCIEVLLAKKKIFLCLSALTKVETADSQTLVRSDRMLKTE